MPGRRADKRQALEHEGTLHPARARVRAALFWEHPAFFDARDELQVKYEMLRAHFVDGQAVTAVCAAYGYSRQTFYLLRERFARRGLAGLRDGRPGPVGPAKCTPEVVAFLEAQRAADPTVSAVALVDRLARDRGVRLHRRTVERLVGRHPRKKNAPRH
jgi:transposase